MIIIQLRSRAKVTTGQTLRLCDAATVSACDKIRHLPLPCPETCGVWKLDAITVLRLVQQHASGQDVTLLGADTCYVHRVKDKQRDWSRPLRTAAALVILCLGSALGLCWFHADVDMPRAQIALYEAVAGQTVTDERLITVPYVIGVALGVAVFYALPSKSATTPLEVKLTEYQLGMEQTEARDMEDDHA